MRKDDIILVFFTYFIFTIKFVYSQTELKIGENRFDNSGNSVFYRLQLSNEDFEYLIINLKLSDSYESYSDPDLFVSKVSNYLSYLGIQISKQC